MVSAEMVMLGGLSFSLLCRVAMEPTVRFSPSTTTSSERSRQHFGTATFVSHLVNLLPPSCGYADNYGDNKSQNHRIRLYLGDKCQGTPNDPPNYVHIGHN